VNIPLVHHVYLLTRIIKHTKRGRITHTHTHTHTHTQSKRERERERERERVLKRLNKHQNQADMAGMLELSHLCLGVSVFYCYNRIPQTE
jgi:hypothetical protein